MGVRVFLTRNSGNPEMERHTSTILMVLNTRCIEFDTVDISAPGMQEMRKFMREKGKKQEGQRNVLPPQIFNGEECRGDFEGFDIANEDGDLEEFLGIPRQSPKAEPVKTGAVAPEVGRLTVGKLDRPAAEDKVVDNKTDPETESVASEIEESSGDLDQSDMGDIVINEVTVDIVEVESVESIIDDPEIESENATETSEEEFETFQDFKHSVETEALHHETEKVNAKTDGLSGKDEQKFKADDDEMHKLDDYDNLDTSSDESSDEDTAVEYMPDGEIVRKKSRGFKQLNNCKRFWKASMMLEKA